MTPVPQVFQTLIKFLNLKAFKVGASSLKLKIKSMALSIKVLLFERKKKNLTNAS
jgi:hypothetical protein